MKSQTENNFCVKRICDSNRNNNKGGLNVYYFCVQASFVPYNSLNALPPSYRFDMLMFMLFMIFR